MQPWQNARILRDEKRREDAFTLGVFLALFLVVVL